MKKSYFFETESLIVKKAFSKVEFLTNLFLLHGLSVNSFAASSEALLTNAVKSEHLKMNNCLKTILLEI